MIFLANLSFWVQSSTSYIKKDEDEVDIIIHFKVPVMNSDTEKAIDMDK